MKGNSDTMKLRFAKFLLLLTIITGACSRGPVYQGAHNFEGAVWNRFDIIKFTVPLKEEGRAYDIYFTLKHTAGYSEPSLPVYIIMNTPSGEERMREISVKTTPSLIKSESAADSLGSVKIPVWKGVSIPEKGNCVISVENIYPKIQAQGVEQIGILVEVSSKTDPEIKKEGD